MKASTQRFVMRASVAAVQGALAALAFIPAAYASDEDPAERAKATNQIEVGALYVDKSSAKFGEFNGLDKSGTYGIVNFQLFGPAPDDSAMRWRLFGLDLGLDTRSLQGEVGEQGKWRVTAGYDGVPRHYSDTYRTMWQGAGSTSLTLPAGYPAASTRLSVSNSAGGLLANWNNIQSPNATATTTGGGPATLIPANMNNFEVGTERKRSNLGASIIFAPGWSVTASLKHEEKDGTKLSGINIGRFSGLSALLPEPISNTIDQFEGAVSYVGKDFHFSVGYYGSIYKNDTNLWTVENAGANNAVLNNVARLAGSPDNEMHQFLFSGGYKFSPTTRLTVSGSEARLTQNESFIDSPAGSTWVVPSSSPNAKVINSFFLAKLVSNPIPNLGINAAYRYEDRDNRTPIRDFLTTVDVSGASTQFSNEPIDRRVQQFNLDGDYRLGRGQSVKAGYEWQEIRRTSKADESPFRADKTRENTMRVEYRNSFNELVTGRVSYAYSQRRLDEYEQGNPQPTNPPAPFPAADPLLGGFEQFFLADRNRDKLRSTLNFQASDSVSLQGTLDYNQDKYPNLAFGLKESKSWVGSLDAAFAASETLTFNAFYTYEDMKMQLDSLAIARGTTASILVPHVSGPPCAPYTGVANTLPADYYTDSCRQWSESQADKIHTLGVGVRYRGLFGGRLDLSGELAYSKAKTPINVTGGTYYSNGVPNSATANVFVAAQSFPEVTSEMTDLRLKGTYALDKSSAIRVMYQYRKLKSSDWAYDAYINSALGVLAVQSYIGPAITSPNYDVNVIGVSYIYRFR
ncbi:MAG: MtrB/PioB family decaheme-associated outer membrane protein [Usitatibacter sp.]